jgi:tetratricopeptide (TPR) repeat protein
LKRQSKTPKTGPQSQRAGPRRPSGARGSDDSPASGRKWLFRLVALVFIPLILLCGIEAGLRLVGYGYDPGLFKKITINGEQFYVNNEAFGLRFFPPQLTRGLGPIRMPVKKPAGTCRIFILGESAAQGDPEPAYGAGRYLEALLSARYPQTHFEIVNLGITAINSHVILPIARDCAKADGDLWIIYMGNNEMVGPFGAATVFGAKAPPLPIIRLNLAIQKTRLGQLLANLGRKLKGGNANAPSWGGMEMFVGNQLPVDDPRKEMVYQNFSRNLHDIVKTGLDSGAKILLNTVAVNLKDCAPFASLVNSNLPPADRAKFDRFVKMGVQAGEQGSFAAAARQFESASGFDPTDAELQFRWGESLLQMTNFAAAREHLQSACDDDALPFRTDSRLNALIASTGRQLANDNLLLFDAAGALATNKPAGLCGDETFYEHVHFNFDGSYQLGREWAGQVAAMLPTVIANSAATNGWASQEDCDLRLGLSDWNRAVIFQHMIGRYQEPPLSGQLNNAGRVKKMETRIHELQSGMTPTNAAKVTENFQVALQLAPDDYFLRENYAVFLQSIGDLPQATGQWRHIHELLPQDFLANFEIGRMLELQGQWAEAETNFRRAVELRPMLTEGWVGLGHVLASQDKYEEALACYATAHQQRPSDAQTLFQSGTVLAKWNRHAEAMEKYREAIKLNPADWEPHYELGGELDADGQLDAAGQEFGAAARLNPGNARAHFNYGVVLAKQNRLDEAQQEFEEAIRIAPAYTKAQEYLAKVRTLKKRSP